MIETDSPFARKASRGAALLRQGRFNEGFPLFDAWREEPANTNKAPPLPFPRWKGQPVAGKQMLVWSEHGFGDQIMYARFAKKLVEDGGIINWICPPELERLLAATGATILSSTINHRLDCDYYVPSSALPLGFDLDACIPNAPYLSAPVRRSRARIGLMPDASTANRSLPASIAQTLAARLGAVDLRPSATGARDFQDTAEIICGLDLVVTVDTAVAHLAGALGKPVWILLPEQCDWRWMEGRPDSPWYPSATLFRGPWDALVDQVLAKNAKTRPDAPIC